VKFEIVGEITDIETIAVGLSIRVLESLIKSMEKVAGARKKALQLLD
jgi:hypothetical protein